MSNINPETGEVISGGRSPRFTTWIAFLVFSTITMGSAIELVRACAGGCALPRPVANHQQLPTVFVWNALGGRRCFGCVCVCVCVCVSVRAFCALLLHKVSRSSIHATTEVRHTLLVPMTRGSDNIGN